MTCKECKKRIDKRSKIKLFPSYMVPKTFLVSHKNHLAGRLSVFETGVLAAKLGIKVPHE